MPVEGIILRLYYAGSDKQVSFRNISDNRDKENEIWHISRSGPVCI